jgi:FSR family fosmidomycin resistance protein-like MFS transporter
LADRYGIEFVYRICAYLPLLGMVAAFLPDIERGRHGAAGAPGGGHALAATTGP